ncbi:MAG: hypothetical protein M3033_04730 [Acidobacteriota bacterium]|nr:hypothetical protein [Acidobacteriota bacterium]
MRLFSKFLILVSASVLFACAEQSKPSTPLETLKSYTQAIKRKDTTQMKLLLSDASIKMSKQEASAQNRTLDDVVKNETLFSETQTSLKFRNEKIDGERATIEVENSFGSWDTVPFVREEGIWKIDKHAVANQMLEQNDQDNKRLDEIINQGRRP